MKIIPLIRLVSRIITRGKFRYSTFDYSETRRRALSDFYAFLPPPKDFSPEKRRLKNPYLKWWIGQAAFLKNAFEARGGHLRYAAGNLAYIRIPKAASTALSYSILRASVPDLDKWKFSPDVITSSQMCT